MFLVEYENNFELVVWNLPCPVLDDVSIVLISIFSFFWLLVEFLEYFFMRIGRLGVPGTEPLTIT